MTLEADLVSWIGTRPDWQQDMVARICRYETIDSAVIASIADRLVSGETTPAAGLTEADIPGSTVAAGSVELIELRDLTGVNALAPNQSLTFGISGLTIVYGDNASGKSGYARVACPALR